MYFELLSRQGMGIFQENLASDSYFPTLVIFQVKFSILLGSTFGAMCFEIPIFIFSWVLLLTRNAF